MVAPRTWRTLPMQVGSRSGIVSRAPFDLALSDGLLDEFAQKRFTFGFPGRTPGEVGGQVA